MPFDELQTKTLLALGERLKQLRAERNLTLKELAYKIQKEPQSINRVELGDINPSYLFLQEVCRGLDIDISDFLKGL